MELKSAKILPVKHTTIWGKIILGGWVEDDVIAKYKPLMWVSS